MAKKTNNGFIWGGTHPFFYHPFLSSFTPDLVNKIVLDIGCGKGINSFLIKATRDLKGAKMIGIDVNENYLSFCREHKIYDKLIKSRLPKLPFKDKSLDFVICIEVIEHLSKKDGEKLLKEIDRVCKERAIVTTPNLFFSTEEGEKEDRHVSLWKISDFQNLEYRVYGAGLKTSLLLGDPLIKIKQALYFLFTPLAYFIPQIGGYIFAVKDYKKDDE